MNILSEPPRAPFSVAPYYNQHISAWKLENLGRNMAVAFARAGEDASLLCMDPASSYFVVSGSLLPVVDTGGNATPSAFIADPILQSSSSSGSASHPAPPDEEAVVAPDAKHSRQSSRRGAAQKGGDKRGLPYRVACGVEGLPVPTCCSWTFSCDDSSAGASAWTCAAQTRHSSDLVENGSAIKSAAGKRPPPPATASPPPSKLRAKTAPGAEVAPGAKIAHDTRHIEGRPILPGQSLDLHLLPVSPGESEDIDPEGVLEAKRSEAAVPAKPVGSKPEGSLGAAADPRRWRLEAREGVCVGRVSRRFLRELELEEPKREVEVKVTFLRQTEVGEGRTQALLALLDARTPPPKRKTKQQRSCLLASARATHSFSSPYRRV